MYMLVAFLALLAFLGGFGGKSAKNVECAKEDKNLRSMIGCHMHILCTAEMTVMRFYVII